MQKLQVSYNDNANKIVNAIKNLNFLINLAMVSNNTKSTLEEPQTFNEAWTHPMEDSCNKWQEAICKEFAGINKQQVWWMTCKSLMPPNCKCIKNKLVCKIKHNSV